MKKQFLAISVAPILASLFLGCNNDPEKTTTKSTTISLELKSAFINGDSLHYVDVGKGEPVIFIHGTLGDYRVWLPHLDTFSKHYRVITYSRRYAYPNKQLINDSADYTAMPHANDLAAFIQSLNAGPVHLVGHSYGAYTALITTMKHPELVKSCVLGEPPVAPLLMKVPGGDTIAAKFFSVAKPAGDAFKSGNDEKAVSLFTGWVLGDTNSYKNVAPEIRSVMLSNTLELRGAVLSTKPFPELTCDDMKKINTPVLLMEGEKTTSFFSTITDEIHKCLVNKEKVTLPGASHKLQMENPSDFNKIVLAFIDKH
ncbi:MAG TPA: alpha/beta hydrolase [Chitinophagaceae bacterium]|nr:alpha/beta hydrolase [Chitinophagaceae bacterium]